MVLAKFGAACQQFKSADRSKKAEQPATKQSTGLFFPNLSSYELVI